MMNFEQRVAVGGTMTPEEIHDSLAGLIADPRFDAVLGAVKQAREAFVQAGSGQAMAPHHGPLAHCQGSVFALDALLSQFRAIAVKPKKRKERPPEEV